MRAPLLYKLRPAVLKKLLQKSVTRVKHIRSYERRMLLRRRTERPIRSFHSKIFFISSTLFFAKLTSLNVGVPINFSVQKYMPSTNLEPNDRLLFELWRYKHIYRQTDEDL